MTANNEEMYIPVVPREMCLSIIQAAHAGYMGHLKGERLIQLIAQRCSWPLMRQDIIKFADKCQICASFKAGNAIAPPPGKFTATEAFEQITIDAFKLGASESGQEWCLTAIDTFSRFAWVMPLFDQTAESQIEALQKSVYHLAPPKLLIADHH